MPLSPKTPGRIQELVNEYLEPEDVLDTADWYELSFEKGPLGATQRDRAEDTVSKAVRRIEFGQNRAWLAALIERIEDRNAAAVARTGFETREYHLRLQERIEEVRREITEEAPREISVEAGREFTAKSDAREMFATAEDRLLVVDPYVDPSTLDCFRDVTVPIRLLVGDQDKYIKGEFAEALDDFRREGFDIEVRCHPGLHDRHAVFNDQCYLIGSSLKDAGKKHFNCIAIGDVASVVIDALEEYWEEAEEYAP